MNGWMDGWMDFTATGHYEIEARLAKPIYSEADDPVGGEEVSRVELDVTPRSELVLAKRCEALAGQVEAFASYESVAQFALALSHVTDPVALPYLRRVLLAKKLVEPIAIEGLEKNCQRRRRSSPQSGPENRIQRYRCAKPRCLAPN
jgi:hypothetical protein